MKTEDGIKTECQDCITNISSCLKLSKVQFTFMLKTCFYANVSIWLSETIVGLVTDQI